MRVARWLGALGAAMGIALGAMADPLSRYNADPNTVTVSGFASGGAMAVQAHVAYSSTFRHAAVFDGAAFFCAQGKAAYASGRCRLAASAEEIPVAELVATTRDWGQRGWIDNPANLASSKVYLFGGAQEGGASAGAVDALRDYYLNFVKAQHLVHVDQAVARHDPQLMFLTMFYGALQPRRGDALTGRLVSVDQDEFAPGGSARRHSMDASGWLFVPAACDRGEVCRVHVAFHGCGQAFSRVGDAFIRQASLNEWADTNNILVLYPQAIAAPPRNATACWDWWGYTGRDYARKGAPQLVAVKRMVERMTSGYSPKNAAAGLSATRVDAR